MANEEENTPTRNKKPADQYLFSEIDPAQEVPEGCTFTQSDSLLVFVLSWSYNHTLRVLVLFLLSLGIGLLAVLVTRFELSAGFETPIAFVLGFLAVSCLYAGLVYMFNKTIIKVDREKISKKDSPLPWGRSVVIWREDVSQFYTREIVLANPQGGAPRLAYNVEMLGNKVVKDSVFVKRIANPDLAKFIEFKLELFWEIANQRVTGEYVPMNIRDNDSSGNLFNRISGFFGFNN